MSAKVVSYKAMTKMGNKNAPKGMKMPMMKKKSKMDAEDRAEMKMGKKPSMAEEKKEGEKMKKTASIKKSGTFHGKSNKLGQGGRAAQMKAQGVPAGVIGAIARAKQAAPGQKNFHKKQAAKAAYMKRVGISK